MTHPPDSFASVALPLPITQPALQAADRFARRQPTATKAAQVRLNTLAVWVVNDYLQLMGIATNLAASDSWNPIMQLSTNAADLEIVGVGRLECRPWMPSDSGCAMPADVWHDRIGYLVVHIDEAEREAKLLGFVETVTTEELPLRELHPPDRLLDHLDRLLHPATVVQLTAQPTVQPAARPVSDMRPIQLGQWFQSVFDAGWQTINSLLQASEFTLAYEFRGDPEGDRPDPATVIRRAKRFDLSIRTTIQPLVLVVELTLEGNDQTQIRLQVYAADAVYLPPGLQLTVLDQTGAVFLQAQSRETDNYLQLELSGQTGEAFSVRIQLGDESITEQFVI
jgi:hypothetical protein